MNNHHNKLGRANSSPFQRKLELSNKKTNIEIEIEIFNEKENTASSAMNQWWSWVNFQIRIWLLWMKTIRMDDAIIRSKCAFLWIRFSLFLSLYSSFRLMWGYAVVVVFCTTVIHYYEWFWPRFNNWLPLFKRIHHLWISPINSFKS